MVNTNREDPWAKVLEGRVAELQTKVKAHEEHIHHVIAEFHKWATEADELDIYYDTDFKVQQITEARETYKAVWKRFKEAEAELEKYKETVGKETSK